MKQGRETDLPVWPPALDNFKSTFVPLKSDFSHVDIPTQPQAGSCLDDSALIQSSSSVCLMWLEGE